MRSKGPLDGESIIWLTAFSTAFAAQVERMVEVSSLNRALEVTTYERAEVIADAAVTEYRKLAAKRILP